MADRKVDTGIVQRGSTYRFTAYCGYDMNGKQIRKTTTWIPPEGTTTQRKADTLAKEAYIEFKRLCTGAEHLQAAMRFHELADEYMKIYATNELRPITRYQYGKLIKAHFNESFGNKKLKEFTPSYITKYFNSNIVGANGQPLCAKSVKKVYTTLQSVFTFAVNQGYLKESPCLNVTLPKDTIQEEKRKFLTEEELKRFLAMFDGYSAFNTIIKVLLYTGMRSGECLGLQWADLDFDNKIIHIRHTLSDDETGSRHILTPPKTKNSKRYIGMSDTVAELLKEHRQHQFELMQAVQPFAHGEMVFTSDRGNYKDRSSLNTGFKRFLKGTEFEGLTLHCLRHCNATLLIAAGVDLKIVSEHLGHSDVGITANVYADVLDSTKRRTAEILEFKIG